MLKILTSSASVLALAICGSPQAFGEIAGVDVAPGGFYISLEGGSQRTSALDVAAHGNISATQSQVSGGYAGVFASAGHYTGVDWVQSTTSEVVTHGTFVTAGHADSPPPQASAYAQTGGVTQSAYSNGSNLISSDDGAFAGFSAGYVFPQPLYGFIQRAELYGSFWNASARQSVAGAAAGLSMDAGTAFASVSLGSPLMVATYVRQTLDQDEIVLRLKTDNWRPGGYKDGGYKDGGGAFAIFASFEPFYKYLSQDTAMTASLPLAGCACMDIKIPFPALASRYAAVTGNFFGAQFALEASYPVAAGVDWIGRASAGVYLLEADGVFKDNFGKFNYITDNVQTAGLRLGAESGLRFTLSPRVWLSATGSIDYLSDVPTAMLPRYSTDRPAHVGLDDLTVYKALGRLTFAVQPSMETFK